MRRDREEAAEMTRLGQFDAVMLDSSLSSASILEAAEIFAAQRMAKYVVIDVESVVLGSRGSLLRLCLLRGM